MNTNELRRQIADFAAEHAGLCNDMYPDNLDTAALAKAELGVQVEQIRCGLLDLIDRAFQDEAHEPKSHSPTSRP